jgi:hypothetical protein
MKTADLTATSRAAASGSIGCPMTTCVLQVTPCHVMTNLQYSWLSPQVDAALHHGGARALACDVRCSIWAKIWVDLLLDDGQN